jgi:hypothetical protein
VIERADIPIIEAFTCRESVTLASMAMASFAGIVHTNTAASLAGGYGQLKVALHLPAAALQRLGQRMRAKC